MTIVPIYAALLALFFVYLSYKVGEARKKEQVLIGAGGSKIVERAMRVHANFAEYTPIALILLAFMEINKGNIYLIHALALIFLVGRVIHAYGLSQMNENLLFRLIGMMATISVIALSAFANIYLSISS